MSFLYIYYIIVFIIFYYIYINMFIIFFKFIIIIYYILKDFREYKIIFLSLVSGEEKFQHTVLTFKVTLRIPILVY